jgi:Family of unknown function (DUF6152)
MRHFIRACAAGALWVGGAAALAHHSLAGFDLERPLTLEGTVTRFDWANPHVYIEMAIEREGGEREIWQVQAEPPSSMVLQGWSRSSLAVGERITVDARPSRNPQRRMALGGRVRKADGTELDIRPRPLPPPKRLTAAPSLAGQWLTEFDPDVADAFLEPLATWPLTEKGAAAAESYNDVDNPSKNCVDEPVPYVMVYRNAKTIERDGDRVIIRDSYGGARTIHLNVDSHTDAPYSSQGHSIGRWTGAVLEVDSARFTEHRRGNAFGLPSGRQKHLVERFALSADGTHATYTFRLEDPEYLAEPVTGALELVHRPDVPSIDERCDPEIARRYLDRP